MGRFANSATIVCPLCSKCGAPMWLARIQPDKPGCAPRTFECRAAKTRLVKSSNWKSLRAKRDRIACRRNEKQRAALRSGIDRSPLRGP
jgi:hypothetical protein